MSYHVSAPLVITKGESGSDLYLYQGAPVPESVNSDEIKRLEEGGLIEKDEGAKPSGKK